MIFEAKLAKLKTLEDELENIVKTAGMEDVKVSRERYHLQLQYRECILQYPNDSHNENVDSMLWRHCFHLPVDYYRRRVRDSKSPQGRWAICELNRIIDSGISFLSTLLHELVSQAGITSINGIFDTLALSPISSSPRFINSESMVPVIYRILIFCGDLARYRCQFNKYFQDDSYSLSWRIYLAAHQLDFDHGHSCNQIAVVCSMLQDALMTVLWYLRAECCKIPFGSARSNLLSYLEKVVLKDRDASTEIEVWKPFLKFFHECLTRTDQPPMDLTEITQWMKKRAIKMSMFEFSSTLMILGAAIKVTKDEKNSFKDCSNRFLTIFLQVDPKAGIRNGTEDDTLLLFLSISALWKFDTNSFQCRDDVIQWVKDHTGSSLTAKSIEFLQQLRGFEIFEDLLYDPPEVSKGSEFWSKLVKRITTTPHPESPLATLPTSSSGEEDDEIVVFRGLL